MINSQEGMGLAAAEGRLKLNYRLATLPSQALSDLGQQQAHSFGDEGALIKCRGVLIFRRRLSRVNGADVGREF
jgi:hypothetical protein